jgi:hypothetical protein
MKLNLLVAHLLVTGNGLVVTQSEPTESVRLPSGSAVRVCYARPSSSLDSTVRAKKSFRRGSLILLISIGLLLFAPQFGCLGFLMSFAFLLAALSRLLHTPGIDRSRPPITSDHLPELLVRLLYANPFLAYAPRAFKREVIRNGGSGEDAELYYALLDEPTLLDDRAEETGRRGALFRIASKVRCDERTIAHASASLARIVKGAGLEIFKPAHRTPLVVFSWGEVLGIGVLITMIMFFSLIAAVALVTG